MKKAPLPILAMTLALAMTLGSCAGTPPQTVNDVPGRLACINNDNVAGRRGAGPGAIDFEMFTGEILRNQFQGRCPGIERLGSTLAVAIVSGGEGGQLCRGDRVRLFDPIETRAVGISVQPSCVLGDFMRVPPTATAN